MNIRAQLLVEHSKKNTDAIRSYIGQERNLVKELFDCFFSDETRVSQRAAMVISAVFDHDPHLVLPYTEELIENLLNNSQHVAIKRNTIRILQFMELPESQTSAVFNHCLENIISVKEPIAVKAFSMTVLLNICKKYPELKQEVIPILELELERNESAGVLNRGKKVLKKLNQLN